MMTPSPATTVVGTYPTSDEADRARDQLIEAGIEPTEVEHLDDDVWQVQAPAERREQALDVVRRMEQHTISDAW
jgi:hypothetical protein